MKLKKLISQNYGGIELYILALVVIGSALLVGGFLPKNYRITSPQNPDQVAVQISDIPPRKENALQLKSVKLSQCASTAAVDFLVDNSGSMGEGTKMQDLKKGLHLFVNRLPDTSVVAMQTFSTTVVEAVPFSIYKDVKTQIARAIDAMTPLDYTHSKDAFLSAQQRLKEAIQKYPNYKFSLIFVSDGIPETEATNNACSGGPNGPLCKFNPIENKCNCFAEEQDPISVAENIKKQGVRIFTIAYVGETDAKLENKLQALMKGVASSSNDYYLAPVESQVETVLSQIATKLCSE